MILSDYMTHMEAHIPPRKRIFSQKLNSKFIIYQCVNLDKANLHFSDSSPFLVVLPDVKTGSNLLNILCLSTWLATHSLGRVIWPSWVTRFGLPMPWRNH